MAEQARPLVNRLVRPLMLSDARSGASNLGVECGIVAEGGRASQSPNPPSSRMVCPVM